MENRKVLNIKGTVLDNNSLKNFMKKISASYEVKNDSSISTYPINRLNENYLFIEKTYRLLNEHIKKGIDIHSAGEWLLDNFYIIEETVKKIKKEMPIKKYKQLPGISGGTYNGFARVYFLASLIVSFRDSIIDDETLKLAISAYQEQRTLNMEEIWNLWIFLEIAIIENIREVCEKIYTSQIQKYKVEDIIERVIENKKQNNTKKIKNNTKSIKNNTYSFKNEIKYPFIEYMSYKLKRLGRKGIAYLNVLENEVDKLGLSIDDAIKKEHFDIAMQKVLIGNSITSIREISRINFLMLFEKINGVEEILKKDPAKIYSKMDYKTKSKYRNTIKEISKKTKISENYISNKVLELCKNKKDKKEHVGYYLIDDGYNELIKALGFNRKFSHARNKTKINRYINAVFIITAFLVLGFGAWLFQKTSDIIFSIIIMTISVIPISEIWIQILNYILVKTIKPSIIPKMDFSDTIPAEYSTIVVIPTIINSQDKVRRLMHRLEVYYLANKSDNLYFALLGDCTASKNEKESVDEDIIKEGLNLTNYLNNKYVKNEKKIFFFLYRNRIWNTGEKSFLGWERKRGLLCQFNEFLINGKNSFRINTIEGTNLKIKYVITLDADTFLCLDTAKQLIGAMAHILNKPKIENRIVTKGHAIMQPRIGIDLESNRKTTFSKIFSGEGGTDLYANAISDVYQDNFGEGIFTGKGIYDLIVFNKVLKKEIPENTVLSHDLLEGCYLRAGLASDIFLMDGCPAKYNSYMLRFHRWTRGDVQLINWLKNTIITKDGAKALNPLSKLSKYKIFDNLRRISVPVFSLILILIGLFIKKQSIFLLGIICVVFPSVLDLGNYIIFKKNETNVAYRNIIKTISNLTASLIRGFLELAFLPNKVVKTIDAITRSIYRLKISKNNLLEWTTSEDVEKQVLTNIKSYYKEMTGNWLLGVVCIFIGMIYRKIITLTIGTIWIIAPIIACIISKETTNRQKLLKDDSKYLKNIGEKTWEFFKDNINEKNNFLPPDNYQEDRKDKVAHRTSPTNIGLRITSNYFCF